MQLDFFLIVLGKIEDSCSVFRQQTPSDFITGALEVDADISGAVLIAAADDDFHAVLPEFINDFQLGWRGTDPDEQIKPRAFQFPQNGLLAVSAQIQNMLNGGDRRQFLQNVGETKRLIRKVMRQHAIVFQNADDGQGIASLHNLPRRIGETAQTLPRNDEAVFREHFHRLADGRTADVEFFRQFRDRRNADGVLAGAQDQCHHIAPDLHVFRNGTFCFFHRFFYLFFVFYVS
mgnify:CR=1 FL=1